MTTIDKLEAGCNSFIALYEEILNYKNMPEDFLKLLKDYYKEQYKEIREMMDG